MMDSSPKLKAEKGCSVALGHDRVMDNAKKKGCSAGAVEPTQQLGLTDPDLIPGQQIQALKPPPLALA